MKSHRSILRHYFLQLAHLSTLLVVIGYPVHAGPAKYDPKTRSFRITYTFAALPSWGMTPDQIEGLGERQEASTAQDTKIRALHQAVSLVIEDVTDKRARISSLDYVSSIKKADVIISLTGNFQRAGWSTQGTIDGRPGQVGLYYLYLDSRPEQEIVYTMAHELSHYLFGLPDEYSSSSVAMCPLQNSDSPGCLMDNYFLRHGYRKICQNADHNPDGPRTNSTTILQGTTAEDSCQLRIDNFFKEHPPGAEVDADNNGAPDPPAGLSETPVTPDEPFTGKFRQLVNSATLAVRDRFQADRSKAKNKQTIPQPKIETFRKYAKEFLDTQIKELDSDQGFLRPTKDQIIRAIEVVAQRVLLDKEATPARFKNKELLSRLREKAKELAGSSGKPGGQLLSLLTGGEIAKAKDLKPIIDKVAKGLLEFVATTGTKALLGLAPSDTTTKVLDPETKRFIGQIAREAVLGTGGATEFSTFVEAANLHIRLSLNASATLNAVASELDLPGADSRRLNLDDLESRLQKFRLPGKPFTGFGYRRTYVVAPHPLDPKFDRVKINAGDNFLYHDIRNLIANQFMRLIQRERTEFVNDPLTPDPITIVRLDALGENSLNANPAQRLRPNEPSNEELAKALRPNERFAKQVSLFTKLIEEIRRDRVENIVILAPPGGLSQELGDVLEEFRSRVLDHPYVRVDVVLFQQGTIPLRLRDLVAQSGGTVQTAIDLDELGAVAQRLKNEVQAGSWVANPQKGYIDFSLGAKLDAAQKVHIRTATEILNFKTLRDHYGNGKGAGWPWQSKDTKNDITKWRMEYRVLDSTVADVENFNTKLRELLEMVNSKAQHSSYVSIVTTLSRLTRLKMDIQEKMGDLLDHIVRDAPNPNTQRQIKELLETIFTTKQSLRTIYGSSALFGSPLTSTDDYMDWNLRKLLVQEATRRGDEIVEDRNSTSEYDEIAQALSGHMITMKDFNMQTASNFVKKTLTELDPTYKSPSTNESSWQRLIYNSEYPSDRLFATVKEMDGYLNKWKDPTQKAPTIAWTLRIMNTSNEAIDVPQKGKKLIVVAIVREMYFFRARDVLHIRIFDSDGKQVLNTDEKKMIAEAVKIEEFKKKLQNENLFEPHVLTRIEKEKIITDIITITGFTPEAADDPDLENAKKSLTGEQKNKLALRVRRIMYYPDWKRRMLDYAFDFFKVGVRGTEKSETVMEAYRRASIKNQRLSDLGQIMKYAARRYTQDEVLAIRELGYSEDDEKVEAEKVRLQKKRDTIQVFVNSIDTLQRQESLSNPDAPSLLLKASRVLSTALYPVESPAFLTHTNMLRVLVVTRILERASQQPIDPIDFGKQVDDLRRYVAQLRGAITRRKSQVESIQPKVDGPENSGIKLYLRWYNFNNIEQPAIRQAELDEAELTFILLDHRKEELLRGAVQNDAPIRSPFDRSSLEDVDLVLSSENSLTPAREFFQDEVVVKEKLNEFRKSRINSRNVEVSSSLNSLENPSIMFPELISTLQATQLAPGTSSEQQLLQDDIEYVKRRTEQLYSIEFPTLVLDILGRLRMFEDDITVISQTFQQPGSPVPTFQRLTRSRAVPQPDLDRNREGQLLKIPFQPFLTEDGAEIEIILGLSRPLRKFEQLLENPPALQLYQGDRLVDRPYLRFDAEVSTETMLVYRAPKPYLKAGLIGKGLYTPKLLIDRKYLPILGRDNTINYTFSVGTPRPNVQLIAGLRQPQPKDVDREFGKDKKEDAFRGTILPNASTAIVEVQVLAGAPVINAEVFGQFQWFDNTSNPIDSPNVELLDNGAYPDVKKDDGIYTGSITLQPASLRKSAEYRIFVQAKSTKDVRFIPLAESILGSNPDEKKEEPAPPPVPDFQRASSINFRASVEN